MERLKGPGSYLFRGGRVIDPMNDLDLCADVLILNGQLAEIRPRIELGAERYAEITEIDVAGKWVVPGLIDMHVHLREPGEEYKETIASGTAAAVAGGYTSVACMPNTSPVNDCAAVTRFILQKAKEEGSSWVFPVGSISRGLQGECLSEFGELRDAGAVAVSDDGRPVMSSLMMRRALEYAKAFDLTVISHAEDLHLSEGGLMNEGPISSLLGLRGIPTAAEDAMVARDLILAEWTRGRLHIAHVSTAGSVRLIREAKRRGVNVTAETAPHYFTLTDEAILSFDPVFKVNPPLRRIEDVRAVKNALADGTIDAIATDHAPHSVVEKDVEFEYAANGIIGLESALPLILDLVREGTLSPSDAIAKISSNPARILGLPLGTLSPGDPVDMTVLDPDEIHRLTRETLVSKGCNCPFVDRDLQGRALMTFVHGIVVYSRLNS